MERRLRNGEWMKLGENIEKENDTIMIMTLMFLNHLRMKSI